MMKLVEVEADHFLLSILKQTHANKEVEIITLIFTTKIEYVPYSQITYFLEGGGEGRDSSRRLCFCCLFWDCFLFFF